MRSSGADHCVAVMSGHFVQRGAPAVFEPSRRVRAALEAGASAVFELPVSASCASAEDFAGYGVSLLAALGCDHISFGIEPVEPALLYAMVQLILTEPAEYRRVLGDCLRAGDSFPAARTRAAAAVLGMDPDELSAAINRPNLILALEYLKANARLGNPLYPYLVERKGAEYHDTDPEGILPSATALRAQLEAQAESDESLRILTADDLLPPLMAVLQRKIHEGEDLTVYRDVSREIADRLRNLAGEQHFPDWDALVSALKTRQYTYTRISRCLLHILLDDRQTEAEEFRQSGRRPGDPALYGRLLGFRKDRADVLTVLKERSSVPIISKAADAEEILCERYGEFLSPEEVPACRMFRQDSYAASVYNMIYYEKYREILPDPNRQQIVIV